MVSVVVVVPVISSDDDDDGNCEDHQRRLLLVVVIVLLLVGTVVVRDHATPPRRVTTSYHGLRATTTRPTRCRTTTVVNAMVVVNPIGSNSCSVRSAAINSSCSVILFVTLANRFTESEKWPINMDRSNTRTQEYSLFVRVVWFHVIYIIYIRYDSWIRYTVYECRM